MKKLTLSLFALAAFSVMFTSCKKEEAPAETPQNTAPSSAAPTINIVDADGALTACRTISKVSPGYGIPDYELNIGLAVGVFLKNKNTNEFVAAGNVTCNTQALSMQSNKSYVYTPPTTGQNIEGIDYGSGTSQYVDVDWNVSGSSDVAAFSGSFNDRFPTNPQWTKSNVKVGKAITINLNSQIYGADSIIVTLASSAGGSVSKTFAGTATSFAFTEDEGKKLAAGDNSMVQIAPWSYKLAPVEGKKFYFVNEAVLSTFTKFE